jgi:NAD(P)-dependent dehydrogenase (short-subunit alcohol dehydrogenase family)
MNRTREEARENARPLEGRIALVTGGGSGIGRSIAMAFADAGAKLVLAGRREKPIREVEQEIGGNAARAVSGDVTKSGDRLRMLAAAEATFGGLDILVNNAGAVARMGSLMETTEEDWRTTLEVNFLAPILLAKEALPMLRVRHGSILNISTGASLNPVRNFGAYGAAKAGLNHASQVLALEAAPEVRVNVICPGGVDTPIFEKFMGPNRAPELKKMYAEITPLGRIGHPEDIASAALFLASDAARFVTGAILTVDGGLNLG